MAHDELVLVKGTSTSPQGPAKVLAFSDLKRLGRSGRILRELLRDRDVTLLTYSIDVLPRPFLSALIARMLGRRRCVMQDEAGRTIDVGFRLLVAMGNQALRDWLGHRSLLSEVEADARALVDTGTSRPAWTDSGQVLYLRSDLWFGVQSGGSVGHIAGVVNSFASLFPGAPLLLTTDPIPTVRDDIETRLLRPAIRYWDFPELTSFATNRAFSAAVSTDLADRNIRFVYQRYSINNFTGLQTARGLNVPLVLEYNGSEVWVAQNWGKPLKYEQLTNRIELLNANGADLVVVVSEPIRTELVNRGVDRDRILVNPNGVDLDRYSPEIKGDDVRARFGIEDRLVIGFIGTFGMWHGAEVLADAYGVLIERWPEWRNETRLLMIGDGPTLAETRSRLARRRALDCAIFPGRTTQSEGPGHLAACDILVSPHVANPDGTPFFGSPTKLFEYMAMGKAIVASDLDQIGDVLDDGISARLVAPGDVNALAEELDRLLRDPEERARLGAAARARAVERHSWLAHTTRIVEALAERVSDA
jgi:glycosyltransferase involved in cell wall biosynthesis